MSKHTHTALKEAARTLADVEGLSYAEARRILERWAAHPRPTVEELRAADEAEFDPSYWYASTASEIPGFLLRMDDYPQRSDRPAAYCHPYTVESLADPGKEAVLSLTARAVVFEGEAALVVEPLTYTPPANAAPGYGHWGNCWSVALHDRGFRYNTVSHLAAPGWSASLTPGPEASAPCTLRITHDSGHILFDAATPLPPGLVARVRLHPEGVPVFCGPCAGTPVPMEQWWTWEDTGALLQTADLIAARIPFTVRGA